VLLAITLEYYLVALLCNMTAVIVDGEFELHVISVKRRALVTCMQVPQGALEGILPTTMTSQVLSVTGDVALQLLRLTSACFDVFPPLQSAAADALHIAEIVAVSQNSDTLTGRRAHDRLEISVKQGQLDGLWGLCPECYRKCHRISSAH
jgi:hypothetical protein